MDCTPSLCTPNVYLVVIYFDNLNRFFKLGLTLREFFYFLKWDRDGGHEAVMWSHGHNNGVRRLVRHRAFMLARTCQRLSRRDVLASRTFASNYGCLEGFEWWIEWNRFFRFESNTLSIFRSSQWKHQFIFTNIHTGEYSQTNSFALQMNFLLLLLPRSV